MLVMDDAAVVTVETAPSVVTVVRRATRADLEAVTAMGVRFLRESRYGEILSENPQQMRTLATQLLDDAQGVLFVADRIGVLVGMLGCYLVTHPLSADPVVTELFWWVDPAHRGNRGIGLRLLRAAEQWAMTAGAVAIQMIAPEPRVQRLYERLGYRFVEAAYQRRL